MDNFFKRTWAEINLDAIRHNYTEIKQSLNPDTKICCVVKADGYGHGASFVAKELERVYNCRITFAPGQDFNNLITGEHDNKSLEAVLKSIEFISGDIKYKKEGINVLLYKE